MRRTYLILFLSLLYLPRVSGMVMLVQDGVAQAQIVCAVDATRSAQLGAFELQHHIALITGVKLPLVTEPDADFPCRIYVGDSPALRSAGIIPPELTYETSLLRFIGNDILLIGNDSPDFGKVDYADEKTFPDFQENYKGTLFAVYDFLELCCGVRFYWLDESGTTYEARKTLSVTPLERQYTPPLDAFREIYYYGGEPFVQSRDSALWKLRWRMSRYFGSTNHNMNSIYFRYYKRAKTKHLAEEFIESRPEYFAQGYAGRGGAGTAILHNNYPGDLNLPPQLCYSNPGVADYYADEVVTYFQGGNVRGGWRNSGGSVPTDRTLLPRFPGKPFFYPIEGGDNGRFCQCENCLKLRSTADHVSEAKFSLLSRVADLAAERAPGAGVSTLAYIQSLYYPENVPLSDHLSVQLCLTVYAWWHPVARRLQHGEYKKWITNEVRRRPLTLWTYLFSSYHDAAVHFGGYRPFPGFYPWKTAELMREFTADGIRGWFTECNLKYNSLEAYVAARIAYEPDCNAELLIDEYFFNYYGQAGPLMRKLYQQIESIYWNPENCPASWLSDPEEFRGPYGKKHPFWGTGLQSPDVNWQQVGAERMGEMNALVDRALQLAGSPSEQLRVRRFCHDIWETARRGYLEQQQRQGLSPVESSYRLYQHADAQGDCSKIDWEQMERQKLRDVFGETEYADRFALCRDSEYLYVDYLAPEIKEGKPITLKLLFSPLHFSKLERKAKKADQEETVLRLAYFWGGDGAGSASADGLQFDFVRAENTSSGWSLRGAIALSKLPFQGKRALSANIIRILPGRRDSAAVAAWQPVFYAEDPEDSDYFGRICQLPYTVEEDSFSFVHKAGIVDDQLAGNRQAGRMFANNGWTMKYYIPPELLGRKTVKLYFRTDISQPGAWFQSGLYDHYNRKFLSSRRLQASDYSGMAFQEVDLGKLQLIYGSYLFFSSLTGNTTEENQFFYLDKIVFE